MKLLFNKPFKKVNKDLSFKSNSVHLSYQLKREETNFTDFTIYESIDTSGIVIMIT